MVDKQKTVATPSASQAEIESLAALPRTLMGGTAAMRAAGETYLPCETEEDQDAYKARLARSTLFNAFSKTVSDMTGKVFVKPLVFEEDTNPTIVEYGENIDLQGRHINVFARDVFFDTLQAGISYLFVDMPVASETKGVRQRTKADEKKQGIRPYIVHIMAENLIGWKSETVDGVETLTQVRIREFVTEDDHEFHEKSVEQIRVLTRGAWTTYRRVEDSKDEWVEHESGEMSVQDIPIFPVYGQRTGFMTGRPPLEKLAELNVAHWQQDSDLVNITHFANVPILFGSGFGDDDKIILGAASMTRNSNENAKLQYVEHSGAAIGKSMERLKELELRMQAMGLLLLVPNPGQSATGEIRGDAKENAPLAMMARALGDALENAFAMMAEFMNLESGGSVVINTDFGIQVGALADVQQILAARSAGTISLETAWLEMQRRGFLSDSFDAETEQGRLDEEAPELTAKQPMELDDESVT